MKTRMWVLAAAAVVLTGAGIAIGSPATFLRLLRREVTATVPGTVAIGGQCQTYTDCLTDNCDKSCGGKINAGCGIGTCCAGSRQTCTTKTDCCYNLGVDCDTTTTNQCCDNAPNGLGNNSSCNQDVDCCPQPSASSVQLYCDAGTCDLCTLNSKSWTSTGPLCCSGNHQGTGASANCCAGLGQPCDLPDGGGAGTLDAGGVGVGTGRLNPDTTQCCQGMPNGTTDVAICGSYGTCCLVGASRCTSGSQCCSGSCTGNPATCQPRC